MSDYLGIVDRSIADGSLTGVVHATAPQPVRNAELMVRQFVMGAKQKPTSLREPQSKIAVIHTRYALSAGSSVNSELRTRPHYRGRRAPGNSVGSERVLFVMLIVRGRNRQQALPGCGKYSGYRE